MDSQFSQVRSQTVPRRFGLPQIGLLLGAFATAVVLALVLRAGRAPKIEIASRIATLHPAPEPTPPAISREEAQSQLARAMARFAATGQHDLTPPAAAPSTPAILAGGDQGAVAPPSGNAAASAAAPAPDTPSAPAVANLPAPAAAAAPQADLPALSQADMRRLADKAAQAIRDGDIYGARLILERAMAAGDVTAIFALAETYDPKVLARTNVKGVKGDPARARELYSAALDKGMSEARARLDALDN